MMVAGGLGVIAGGFLLAVAFLLSALGYTCALLRIVACWQIWEMGFGALRGLWCANNALRVPDYAAQLPNIFLDQESFVCQVSLRRVVN